MLFVYIDCNCIYNAAYEMWISSTWLSRPSVISIMKNNIAQSGAMGRRLIASGYTMKARPGPCVYVVYNIKSYNIRYFTIRTCKLYMWVCVRVGFGIDYAVVFFVSVSLFICFYTMSYHMFSFYGEMQPTKYYHTTLKYNFIFSY